MTQRVVVTVPFVESHQRLYPLREGENLLGAGPDCDVRIPEVSPDQQLTISVGAAGSFVWASANGGNATLNGRLVSQEPLPLFHGDQLTFSGQALVYIDDKGGTSDADRERALAPTVRLPRAPAAQAETGSRIVAVLRRLDDGRSYVVDRAGFQIGREKRCEIVIADRSVSRLHAEIAFDRGRYLLRDLGRNGTRVNGEKIREAHELSVGDVIQVGKYEFAFSLRPASAEAASKPQSVTPVRGAVADAPTVEHRPVRSGSPVLRWLLILAIAGVAAAIILTA